MKNSNPFELTPGDFQGLFSVLEWWVKPLLQREIERNNINKASANARWVAWTTTKRLAMAMTRSGMEPEELIAWLENMGKEMKSNKLDPSVLEEQVS